MTASPRPEDVTFHRPWPLPAGSWILEQSWHDLLFAHWPVDAGALRAVVPRPLEIDVFSGRGWIGVVPFRTTGLRLRGLPPLPLVSRFPELNVRTYVTLDGKPGVYFFSLDATSVPAVIGARTLFRLPYHRAAMHVANEGNRIRFQSRRLDDDTGAEFSARYWPTGAVFHATEPGTIEHFLAERYCLYTGALGPRILRVEIHHAPWPLQPAAVEIDTNTMARAAGIVLPDAAPLAHFARAQPTLVWPPELVGRVERSA
jgi:uncharacterized protein YqjF (DUF2071 family)